MSDQYGVVGSAATLVCVGISPAGNVPQLSIYKGSSLLSTSDNPDLLKVSISQ